MALDLNSNLQMFKNFVSSIGMDDNTVVGLGTNCIGSKELNEVSSATYHDRTWHSGNRDVNASINRNNATRQAFLDALIDQFCENGKERGFSCLPAYIRKALKGTWSLTESGDFGLKADASQQNGVKVTSGKPLTARRIRAVFEAIAKHQSLTDVKQPTVETNNTAIASGKPQNKVEQVDNRDDPISPEAFKDKFHDCLLAYDFGTPMVGKKMVCGKDYLRVSYVSVPDDIKSKNYPMLGLNPNGLYDFIDKFFDQDSDDMEKLLSHESRTNGDFYEKFSKYFCTKVKDADSLGSYNKLGRKGKDYFEELMPKVVYDFVVNFNKDNPQFEIVIPDDVKAKFSAQNG